MKITLQRTILFPSSASSSTWRLLGYCNIRIPPARLFTSESATQLNTVSVVKVDETLSKSRNDSFILEISKCQIILFNSFIPHDRNKQKQKLHH